MTSASASSDTVTIAAHIQLIRCQGRGSGDPAVPFVSPIEARTEVVVITGCSELEHVRHIVWNSVIQQWSRSGSLELPNKGIDAYGHILRVWYVLQGGTRERCHDLFTYNWDRTLEFLKSGTTSNIYLQFFFWPSGDEKSETASPPPYELADRDCKDGVSEILHTSEEQNETTPENQNVEEDEVESHTLNQEAHCPEDPRVDTRVDSATSSPVRGNVVRKNSTSKASGRSPRMQDLRPRDMVKS